MEGVGRLTSRSSRASDEPSWRAPRASSCLKGQECQKREEREMDRQETRTCVRHDRCHHRGCARRVPERQRGCLRDREIKGCEKPALGRNVGRLTVLAGAVVELVRRQSSELAIRDLPVLLCIRLGDEGPVPARVERQDEADGRRRRRTNVICAAMVRHSDGQASVEGASLPGISSRVATEGAWLRRLAISISADPAGGKEGGGEATDPCA